eukprot:scaffold22242_cov68-Attheya_sp.AAC.1
MIQRRWRKEEASGGVGERSTRETGATDVSTGKGVAPAVCQTLPCICHTVRCSKYQSTRHSDSRSVSTAAGVSNVATGKVVAAAACQMLLSLFATPSVAPIIDRLVALVLNPSFLLPASQMWLLGRALLLLLLVKCCLFFTRHTARRSDYRSTCRSDSLS